MRSAYNFRRISALSVNLFESGVTTQRSLPKNDDTAYTEFRCPLFKILNVSVPKCGRLAISEQFYRLFWQPIWIGVNCIVQLRITYHLKVFTDLPSTKTGVWQYCRMAPSFCINIDL